MRKRNNQSEKLRFIEMNPARVLILGFLILIGIGTLLLMIPAATQDRHHLSFVDALFEATSAVCVTGLVVVDTQTTFTTFGQMILMVLIQIGGLGFMIFSVLIALLLGKNIGLRNRLRIHETYNQLSLDGMIKLVKFILLFTLSVEALGTIALTIRWISEFGFTQALFYGIFHSISAFNNAGFDLMGNYQSMTAYVGDGPIILTLSSLVIIGGIGYIVMLEIFQKKSFKNLSLHTKIVLIMTIGLNVVGTILFFLLEFRNSGTLDNLSFKDQMLGSYFHAVVPRTAGFNSVEMGELTLGSQVMTMLYMFIGGGSGGTAGGIKVTTFALILLAVWAIIKGDNDINILHRRIPKELILKAFTITIFSGCIVFFILFILTMTEKAPLNVLMFEVFSAFGTVGMSMGLTPELSTAGKLVITTLMFLGRVGPLTLAFALTKRNSKVKWKNPEEKIMIG